MKAEQKGISNRHYVVPVTSFVRMAKAALFSLAAGPKPRGYMNCVTVQERLLEIYRLAKHACEKGHQIGWNEARLLNIEANIRYWK